MSQEKGLSPKTQPLMMGIPRRCLEWQIVGSVTTLCGRLCRWEGCSSRCGGRCHAGCWRRREGAGGWHRLGTSGGSLCGGGVVAVYPPGTNIVEPTALILMGVDVEADTKILTHLYVELRKALCSEHPEDAFLGELLKGFYYKILALPGIPCALGHAPLFGHRSDDFSFNFHVIY